MEANATQALDEIDFDITYDVDGNPAPRPCQYDVPVTPPITAICPTYTLPTISAPLIIDGTTQTATPPAVQPRDGSARWLERRQHRRGRRCGRFAYHSRRLDREGPVDPRLGSLWYQSQVVWRQHHPGELDRRRRGRKGDLTDDPWVPNTNDGIYVDNVSNNLIGGTGGCREERDLRQRRRGQPGKPWIWT